MTEQQQFISKYIIPAMVTQFWYKIPASVTMAQAILESGWGKSSLTVNANNFFGIKANSSWNGKVYDAQTNEYYNGQKVTIVDGFRVYNTPLQSFKDHAKFLQENKRYNPLFELSETDYTNWAKGLQTAGYATDPTYASKLINIVSEYKLNKYDLRLKSLRYLSVIGLIFAITLTSYALYKNARQ